MTRTVEHAERAGEWAHGRCASDREGRTFWELLVVGVRRELDRRPWARLVKRDQVSVPEGVNHNYWPALSRMLIMADPTLALYIRPRRVAELDCPEGASVLAKAYERATGHAPSWRDWREAAAAARGDAA